MNRIEGRVHAALRDETSGCHPARGLILVAHRFLAAVNLCDMPESHDPSCDSLHVPPGVDRGRGASSALPLGLRCTAWWQRDEVTETARPSTGPATTT
jgi:hypothetical protein